MAVAAARFVRLLAEAKRQPVEPLHNIAGVIRNLPGRPQQL